MKDPSWQTRIEGGQRVCATCGTAIGSYRYRFHPAESSLFERCIGLGWCSKCMVYAAGMVHVPRGETLVDALAYLPADRQDQLKRSELKLVRYLANRAPGGGS